MTEPFPAPGTAPSDAGTAAARLPGDGDDPMAALAGWLPGTPGEDGCFPLLSLATVDAQGIPDVRTVLLSEIHGGQLFFHTDAASRKAEQLRDNGFAALSWIWPERARQVVLRGPVAPASPQERDAAYRNRSRYLQLLAWQNTATAAQQPVAARIRDWAAFDSSHPELDPPDTWAGFALTPDRVTFWHGAADAPSHRVEFTRAENGWQVTHLPG